MSKTLLVFSKLQTKIFFQKLGEQKKSKYKKKGEEDKN